MTLPYYSKGASEIDTKRHSQLFQISWWFVVVGIGFFSAEHYVGSIILWGCRTTMW